MDRLRAILDPLIHGRRGGAEARSAENDASETAIGAAGDEEQMTYARAVSVGALRFNAPPGYCRP